MMRMSAVRMGPGSAVVTVVGVALLLLTGGPNPVSAKTFDHADGPYTWTYPGSNSTVIITENVYIGCDDPSDTTGMTFEWKVENVSYP